LAPKFVQNFLNTRKNCIVNFDGHWGMYEFSKHNNLLRPDGFHPGSQANMLMSKYINKHLLLNII
jgi:hypothetical protein